MKDTVVSIQQPASAKDALTEVLREGAQRLLAEAVDAEVESFLEEYQELRDKHGRRRVVRNGYLPEREVQTGLGGIKVRVPRTRDRDAGGESEEAIRFRSCLVPPYLRRSKSVEELLPVLYLKGISTGDFGEALSALLGPEAPGLSAKTISRLKQKWTQDYEKWRQQDLSKKRYVYWWADGVYCNVRF
ncbi:MAG: transposase, partial [Acidobacteriota bacterium]